MYNRKRHRKINPHAHIIQGFIVCHTEARTQKGIQRTRASTNAQDTDNQCANALFRQTQREKEQARDTERNRDKEREKQRERVSLSMCVGERRGGGESVR